MDIPKFHDRVSLSLGVVAGLTLFGISIVEMVYLWGQWRFWWEILPLGVGLVLAIHCFDMIKYYKKHRIVKIEKTDTHRIITKQ